MLKTITKSTVLSSLMLGFWSIGTKLALAQATCTVNGREVPCEELAESAKGFFAWGIGGFLFIFALIVLATVFWIMMIVHAAKHPINNKGIWIVVMIFTGTFGALIYYFAVKRKFNQQFSQPTMTAPR